MGACLSRFRAWCDRNQPPERCQCVSPPMQIPLSPLASVIEDDDDDWESDAFLYPAIRATPITQVCSFIGLQFQNLLLDLGAFWMTLFFLENHANPRRGLQRNGRRPPFSCYDFRSGLRLN